MRKQADEAAALNEKLRTARAKAQFVRPYFARALYALIFVLVEDGGKQTMSGELRTMACDKHYRLYASKAFIARADIDTLAACLIHEIGHILRRHFDRFEARGVTAHTAHLAAIAGDCFPPGTTLGDGLPIEAERESTYGGNGGVASCVQLVRPWSGELVTIRGAGIELRSTPEHPVWIYRRRHKKGLTPVRLLPPSWEQARDVRVGDFMLVPDLGRRATVDVRELDMSAFAQGPGLRTSIPLTADTAWLLGLYAAEGSGRLTPDLSLGLKPAKERALARRASRIAKSLGYVGKITPERDNVSRVRLGGPILARAMKAWCGDGHANKRCPDFILRHTDLNVVRAFLQGFADGDGNVGDATYSSGGKLKHAQYTQIHTTSRAMAVHVRLLLARLRLGFWGLTIIQKDREINGAFVAGGQPIYNIGWSWAPKVGTRQLNGKTVQSWTHEWRLCDEGTLIPIKSVSVEPYNGVVHNLSCNEEHTFIAEGVKVHNCELNDDIREDLKLTEKLFPDVKLPEWCWFPSTIGCPDNMSMEYYYDHLRQKLPPQLQAELAAGDGVPRDGNGNPESTMSGNDPRGGKKADQRARSRMLGRFGGQCGSGAHGVPQSWDQPPPGNGGPEGLEDADVRDIERITANAILEEAQRGRGRVPGDWVSWANEIIRPKPIPWEQLAEAALSRAIDQVAGVVLHSYSRPSRRQSAFEDAIMPAMRRPVPFVAMVGDTSGSMSDRDLQLGRGIVTDCCDSLGARIAFVACDAEVHGEVQYATDGTHLELRGRGGTNMCKGIEFALTEIIPCPDLLVVWTDGDTPWPDEPTPVPVVALIVRPKEGWMGSVPSWITAVAVTPEEEADDDDD